MTRTLRSKRLRAALFRAANGKCQLCGCELGEDWHADHIVPWVLTRRTNVHEMQALCPACNTKKGSSMQIELSNARPGQRRAIQSIVSRVVAGESHTSVVLPTRYGKSDVIRLSALQLFADQQCAGSIVLSPGGDLRSQVVRKTKLQEMCRRYNIPFSLAKRVHELRKTELQPFANGVYLVSTTIQYANRNRDDMRDLIDKETSATGLPFVVFVDETHMLSSRNEWGKSVASFIDAGACAVLLTATADRADNAEIPGFRYEQIDQREHVKRVRTRKGEIVDVDLYKGNQVKVRIDADVNVTFKEAWNEEPSPLCTLSRDVIDVSVRQIIDSVVADDDELLSELSPSQARLVIGKAVRDERVMRKGVAMFVSELQRAKEVAPELAGIVFTGHDQDSDSEANKHANEVRTLIEEMSDLDCVIATSRSEDDSVSNHLQRFESGRGDVLIVKNAGGAGFDCSRLKVLLDLSSVRTFASTVQRVMRVATPHGKVTNAVVITIADVLMSAIWESVVTDSGGDWIDGSYDLVDRWEEKPGTADSGKRSWRIEGGSLGAYDDILGKTGDMEIRAEVESLLSDFPEIGMVRTKPQIAEILKTRRFHEVAGELPDEQIGMLQKSIVRHMEKLAKKRGEGVAYDAAVYRANIKACYAQMFEAADVEFAKIEAITDLETLRKLEASAAALCQEGGVVWR